MTYRSEWDEIESYLAEMDGRNKEVKELRQAISDKRAAIAQ